MRQKPKTLKLTDPVEAAVGDQIVVRLITPEEKPRWDERVTEHHYLKNAQKASGWQRVGATAGDRGFLCGARSAQTAL